jgi:hypothetical protein
LLQPGVHRVFSMHERLEWAGVDHDGAVSSRLARDSDSPQRLYGQPTLWARWHV